MEKEEWKKEFEEVINNGNISSNIRPNIPMLSRVIGEAFSHFIGYANDLNILQTVFIFYFIFISNYDLLRKIMFIYSF